MNIIYCLTILYLIYNPTILPINPTNEQMIQDLHRINVRPMSNNLRFLIQIQTNYI